MLIENTQPANAPVSYPFLWDTPQQRLEQWIGIAKSGGPLDIDSLARNVGEVLGVFADFVIPDDPFRVKKLVEVSGSVPSGHRAATIVRFGLVRSVTRAWHFTQLFDRL